MKKLDYKRIQEIEMSATKKLLKYISKEMQDENILDKLEFYYPDFGEYKHRLAFNVWISIDFIGPDGKTFIEKFLKEKSSGLTSQEKIILIERNKSKLSLFEVIAIHGEFIEVLDMLQNKIYNLWEPEMNSMISTGDFIFGRVGNLLDNMGFIGDINYLPNSIKDIFLEEVLVDFNHLRLKSPLLTISEYLKKYSINLYKIYTNCIYEAIEMDEDITSIVYDELDEFEIYLEIETPTTVINKYISNLLDFFEYYLADEDLTLYDLNKVDLICFFHTAIEDGFIVSQEDLNSYIATFKKYLGFLSNKDSNYKDIYKEMLHISKSRFELMNQLKLVKSPFVIDKELSNAVSNYLNEDAISFIMDYDKFILYILDYHIGLTEKNKYIKRKNLLEINQMLESPNYTNKKSPNQKDFPIIDLFYNLSLKLGLISISDDALLITEKGTNYLRLRDEDKYTLFFQYIWNNDFISIISNIENKKTLKKIKKDMINFLSSLNEDKNYEISTILSKFTGYTKFFLNYYLYLQYLGIIKYSLYPNYEIKVTPLGKVVLNLFEERNHKKTKCPVIHLQSYKKS